MSDYYSVTSRCLTSVDRFAQNAVPVRLPVTCDISGEATSGAQHQVPKLHIVLFQSVDLHPSAVPHNLRLQPVSRRRLCLCPEARPTLPDPSWDPCLPKRVLVPFELAHSIEQGDCQACRSLCALALPAPYSITFMEVSVPVPTFLCL